MDRPTAAVHKHHTTMHNVIEMSLRNNVSRLILMPVLHRAECHQYAISTQLIRIARCSEMIHLQQHER